MPEIYDHESSYSYEDAERVFDAARHDSTRLTIDAGGCLRAVYRFGERIKELEASAPGPETGSGEAIAELCYKIFYLKGNALYDLLRRERIVSKNKTLGSDETSALESRIDSLDYLERAAKTTKLEEPAKKYKIEHIKCCLSVTGELLEERGDIYKASEISEKLRRIIGISEFLKEEAPLCSDIKKNAKMFIDIKNIIDITKKHGKSGKEKAKVEFEKTSYLLWKKTGSGNIRCDAWGYYETAEEYQDVEKYEGFAPREFSLEYTENALEIYPDYRFFYLRGNIYFKMNDREKALENYEKAVKMNPLDPYSLLNLGTVLNGAGKYYKAIVPLKKSIGLFECSADDDDNKKYVHHSDAYYKTGLCRLGMNRLNDALACFKKALDLDPGNLRAKDEIEKTTGLIRNGSIIGALNIETVFGKNKEIDGDNNEYYVDIHFREIIKKEIEAKKIIAPPENACALLKYNLALGNIKRAVKFFQDKSMEYNKRLDLAEEMLTEWINENEKIIRFPSDGGGERRGYKKEAYYLRGLAYFIRERYLEAREDIEKVKSMKHGEAWEIVSRDIVIAGDKNFFTQIDEGIKILNDEPKNIKAITALGCLYIITGSYQRAVYYLNWAVQLREYQRRPDEGMTGRTIKTIDGNKKYVLKYLMNAGPSDEDMTAYYCLRSKAHYALENFKEAENDVNKALEADPGSQTAASLLYAYKHGQGSNGILFNILFAGGEKTDREYALKLYKDGAAYCKEGKYTEGINALSGALVSDPDFSPAYRTRADAYLAMEDYRTAYSGYHEALAVNPGDTAAMRKKEKLWGCKNNPDFQPDIDPGSLFK